MATIITLPHLMPWQREVYDEVAPARKSGRIYVAKAKRQVGKSIVAVCLLITYCLREKCTSVCVEPTQAQSRRVYKQVIDFLQGSGAITSANATLLIIGFSNGSEILFKSAEQGDNLRGAVCSGIMIIDEGAFIDKSIYEILWPICDANSSPVLVISTPLFADESNEFYNLYMRGLTLNDQVKSFDWSKYDTSVFLPKVKLEYYRRTMSPLRFRSEYEGEFIIEGSYIMGDITPCISGYSNKPSVYGGIDWGAGNGEDYTILTLMDEDGHITKIWSSNDKDATEQIEEISTIINTEPALKSVQVEMNSIGKVFYDMLRQKTKKDLKKFITNNESKRRIIEQLIAAFQNQEIGIPNDDELIKELRHYNMEKTAKGGYTYNGADGVHDDRVISLALVYDNYLKKNNKSFTISFV